MIPPDSRKRLFSLYVAIIEAVGDPQAKLRLITLASAVFPYSREMGRFAVSFLEQEDETLAWAGAELIWLYLGKEMTATELESLFSESPGLLTRLLHGERGQRVARAFLVSLAAKGGLWGVESLKAEIEDPMSPIDKAEFVLALGASDDLDWSYLAGLMTHGGPELSEAASTSLGRRASRDDDAYHWLRQTAASWQDPERQLLALEALQSAGREDTVRFLEQQVLPSATGAVKAQALNTYAFEEGAELEVVKAAALRPDDDPNVRSTAALSWMMATRDRAATLGLLETMAKDPDLGDAASVALTIVYEAEGNSRADLFRPPLFDAMWGAREVTGANLFGLGQLDGFLEMAASPEFGDQATLNREISELVGASSPLSDRWKGQAWLSSWAHEVAAEWRTRSNKGEGNP